MEIQLPASFSTNVTNGSPNGKILLASLRSQHCFVRSHCQYGGVTLYVCLNEAGKQICNKSLSNTTPYTMLHAKEIGQWTAETAESILVVL